jgi:hypothetical protein
LPPVLGIKTWALASIFRTGEALAERRRPATELLPEEVEPDPLFQEDDEDFWQFHQLDYPRGAAVFSGTLDHLARTPRTTTSLSADSLRGSVKSFSCTRSTV